MKIIKLLFGGMTLLLLTNCSVKHGSDKATVLSEKSGKIVVEINYGPTKAIRTCELQWSEKLSALMALQLNARVETQPAGPFYIVTSIDSIAGKRGIMAWYYQINHKDAEVMAMNYQALPGDTISWIYTADVCSGKVDGCKK